MQVEHLRVTGMTCGGCSNSVTKALKAVSGVGDVTVSLPSGEATVNYDEQLASLDQLKAAVRAAGFGVDARKESQSSQSTGNCCE